MNNPEKEVLEELRFFGEFGFDFVDLAIEGPLALPERLLEKEREIKDVLASHDMFAVAHVPWYFEIGHPYEGIRKAFLKETIKVLETAARFGVEKLGVHLSFPRGKYSENLDINISSIKELVDFGKKYNMTICIENFDIFTFSVSDFHRIFDQVPGVKLLFEIGHANLGLRKGEDMLVFLREFKDRIAHIHAHDNKGGDEDLHSPIGSGAIDWERVIKELKKFYDDTITLEIFAGDMDYLKISKEKFLQLWNRFTFP
jgi:sugar phosphate isomerase/epimerase